MAGWTRDNLKHINVYRPGKRISEVREELGLEEIYKLSSNESPLPPFKSAVEAIRKVAEGLNRYPDSGAGLLKNKLVGDLGVSYENLSVGNGSNELIRLLAQVVLEPGDEVIMATPSFVVYPIVTEIMNATPVKVPLTGLKHDLEAMAGHVTNKTKIIFVCNPNNPTGTIVTADSVKRLMKTVPEDMLVCFDEAYHEYVTDPGYQTGLDLRAEYENVIVLRTFSKIYSLAGARVGYGVMPEEVVEAIDKVREPFNINTPAQVAARASLDDQDEVRNRRRSNREQRDRVQSALDRLDMRRAESQANFVYFSAGLPAGEAFEKLKKQGVIVRALGDADFIRATLGTAKENAGLIAALESLSS